MHIFDVRLERAEPPVTLLVVQFSGEHSFENILELLYNTYPKRAQASAILLRPDVRDTFTSQELTEAIKKSGSRQSQFLEQVSIAYADQNKSFARFSGLPIFVLYAHNHELLVSANINPLTTTPPEVETHLQRTDLLGDIRSAEMRFLMAASGAVLPHVENTYYDNPSGRAARSFLRVGNIQYSRLAVDAVAFWLLPYLRDCEAILVDTWSLSSVGMNVSRVLATIRSIRPIPVEMLSQYQNDKAERRSELTEILDRLISEADMNSDHPVKIVCIVSVTHTGSLVKVLREQIEISGRMVDLQFVALFRLSGSGDLEALCDLSDDEQFKPFAEGEISGRTSIPIDERIYFPVRYVTVPHEVRIPQAMPFRSFVNMVQGKNVISAHRNQTDDGRIRHHAVHLDTEKLALLPNFKTAFEIALHELEPPPSVILSPSHAAARSMSVLACDMIEKFGYARPEALFHANLELKTTGLTAQQDEAIREKITQLPPESSILILDDCYITGTRLAGYQTRLRHHDVKARIHYMVGVARPDDPSSFATTQRMLGFRAPEDQVPYNRNTVSAVFQVTLPNWQEEQCPWCQEKMLYERLQHQGKALPAKFRDRHLSLAEQHAGLQNDLFLDPGTSPITLYSGSILAPLGSNQAEVFAAVAAAIQRLRVVPIENKPLLGPRHHPIATVLSEETYLHTVYTDSVIRASFLRGADWQELVYEDRAAERERSRLIEEIMINEVADISNLGLELVLAHGLRKCSVPQEAVTGQKNGSVIELFELLKPDGE